MNELPSHWPPAPQGRPGPADRRKYMHTLMTTPDPTGQRPSLWETGESSRVLARYWGFALGTIENDATATSHVVRAGLADLAPLELQSRCIVTLNRAEELAEVGAKDDPIGAGKLLVSVAKEVAAVTGAAAPRRIEARVSSGGDDWLTEEVKDG